MAYKVMLSPNMSLKICMSSLQNLLFKQTRNAVMIPSTCISRYSTKTDSNDSDDEEIGIFEGFEDEDTGVLTDEQIQEKRDVSRLPKIYHSMMDHVQNVEYIVTPREPFQEHGAYKRRMYAKFGKKTGLDPGIMWPTKEEMASMIEDDKEWDPSLQEMCANMEKRNQEEDSWKRKKEEHVDSQLAKMPKYIEQFKAAREGRREKAQELIEKKKILLEDARDYFGYNLHPNDPRLQQMIEEKKVEEDLAKRKKKKEEKKAKVARLLALQLGAKSRGPKKVKVVEEKEES